MIASWTLKCLKLEQVKKKGKAGEQMGYRTRKRALPSPLTQVVVPGDPQVSGSY